MHNTRVAAQPTRCLSLWGHLHCHYRGRRAAMAAHCDIPPDKLSRWASEGAIVAKWTIYLRASKFPESPYEAAQRDKALADGTTGYPLAAYIRRHHGSQATFAYVYDTHSQQVSRWCQRDCLLVHDQVYRPVQRIKRR